MTIRVAFILLLFSFLLEKGLAQPVSYTTVSHQEEWCSSQAQYQLKEYEAEVPPTACWENGRWYGAWFQFKATTDQVQVVVKVRGDQGTLKFPKIAIWDAAMEEVMCKSQQFSSEQGDNFGLATIGLVVGKTYRLVVTSKNLERYASSTFALCVKNKIDHDYRLGAQQLEVLSDWCSTNKAYTTADGSADEQIQGCFKGDGPNFNKWFQFVAASKSLKASVVYKDEEDYIEFPQLYLLDQSLKMLKCDGYTDEHPETSLNYDQLSVGQTYYLMVDHNLIERYRGKFGLCISNTSTHIVGELIQDGRPITPGTKVSLLLEGERVASVLTDQLGKFKFNDLQSGEAYEVECTGSFNHFRIVQVGADNTILKKAVRRSPTLFSFVTISTDYNDIVLLNLNKKGLSTKPGTIGYYGKAVKKGDLFSGVGNLKVTVYDGPNQTLQTTNTNDQGEFSFDNLPKQKNYLVKFGESDQEIYGEIITYDETGSILSSSNTDNMDENGYFQFKKLPPIKEVLNPLQDDDVDLSSLDFDNLVVGASISLHHIYFEAGSYKLKPSSYEELDALVKQLKQYPSLQIVVEGHTDGTGSEKVNLKISQQRAGAVVQYLVDHNISAGRLKAEGMGSSKRKFSDATPEGRKKNRRVEFRVAKN